MVVSVDIWVIIGMSVTVGELVAVGNQVGVKIGDGVHVGGISLPRCVPGTTTTCKATDWFKCNAISS